MIYYFIDRFTALFWLSLIVLVMLQLEYMRLKGYIRYPNILLRPFEEHRVAGYAYSTTAAFIVIALFPKTIAIAAMAMAIIGDTSTGIAGAVLGKDSNVRQSRLPLKPVPVLAVMFMASFASGYLATLAPAMEQIPVFSILMGALGATLADGVPWQVRGRVLDDNFTIPVVSALLMFLSAA